jgi:hypothetical protein
LSAAGHVDALGARAGGEVLQVREALGQLGRQVAGHPLELDALAAADPARRRARARPSAEVCSA